MRYRTDLTREHRIVWNGEAYDITQIIDVGARHHTTEILATHGIRNGR
jgi:head-tail adaptor